MTDRSTELPIQDCNLEVRVGIDGVWLYFGKYAAIHVHNTLGMDGSIIAAQINHWCIEREKQAKQINDDNGQFGVGA